MILIKSTASRIEKGLIPVVYDRNGCFGFCYRFGFGSVSVRFWFGVGSVKFWIPKPKRPSMISLFQNIFQCSFYNFALFLKFFSTDISSIFANKISIYIENNLKDTFRLVAKTFSKIACFGFGFGVSVFRCFGSNNTEVSVFRFRYKILFRSYTIQILHNFLLFNVQYDKVDEKVLKRI